MFQIVVDSTTASSKRHKADMKLYKLGTCRGHGPAGRLVPYTNLAVSWSFVHFYHSSFLFAVASSMLDKSSHGAWEGVLLHSYPGRPNSSVRTGLLKERNRAHDTLLHA